ncbi:glycosyltransferase family 4 protein [Afipia sp. P52-10]|uniref:glycosyltransferase family 4 protein n=1 Tax=Afipia sp. P52-10 TaxID=1429916 RepID=UPI0004ACF0CF|nr:glycosyltransferase family 4 protein [Afipia sp. P52-10]
MRVLYVDGVGPFGGASRSLFEAIRALPSGSVEGYFLAAEGTALDYYRRVAKDVVVTRGLTRFDNTQYSHYRGARWLVLLREAFHMPFTLACILRAKAKWRSVDVIHVNEITEIIPGLIAKTLFRAPVIVHVRSPQRKDERSIRSRAIHCLLRSNVAAVVAIDETVRSSLPADIDVDVIHNSFTPLSDVQDADFRNKLGQTLTGGLFTVGYVGSLHTLKGIEDLVEAAKIVCSRRDDVQFAIVGGVTGNDRSAKAKMLGAFRLGQNVATNVINKVHAYGLGSRFHLLGPTNDITSAYNAFDVLAFPSHLNAVGRPVFEAAFAEVPSIVAIKDPKPDTLVHGETGLSVPDKSPEAIADAICFLADRRDEAARMGRNARALAEINFGAKSNSARLLEIYRRVHQGEVAGGATRPTT